MSGEVERRMRAAYFGGIVLFAGLAWLFRINLLIGLVVMPVVMHLITAERARRAGKGAVGTALAAVYRYVIARELLAAGLFAMATWYVVVRMAGAPRLGWAEGALLVLLVAWTLVVRGVVALSRSSGSVAGEGTREDGA